VGLKLEAKRAAKMRNQISLFAACTLLQAWSGAVDAQDRAFSGYYCSEGCSSHANGYRWAEQKQITDSSECPLGDPNALDDSISFHEGCLAYSEDPGRGADEDDDGNPIEQN